MTTEMIQGEWVGIVLLPKGYQMESQNKVVFFSFHSKTNFFFFFLTKAMTFY